ncbi:heme oxygenase-like multi-helical [Penicillium angulare]|uniref:Heme oxygenase-like multi-helical n=1 Tax=Penicillium angulare TaxID=116970 RepID=A0A9W9F3E9_9EURO|nr:heme oxygenase-like multi-helical [Penicillium angulare]
MTSHLLTTYLLESTPKSLKRATTHPFLAAAGRGTLPKATLSQWLSQDRLYAQSYIRFIGSLLSKIHLESRATNPPSALNTGTPDQQAVSILIDALVNIRRELQFFDATAADYGLDLSAISPCEGGPASGCITTSAAISTKGSGSCPGSTGCSTSTAASNLTGPGDTGPSASGGAVNSTTVRGGNNITSAERDEYGNENVDSAHRLCEPQGECQMQGGEVCYPSSQSNAAQARVKVGECEPCEPSVPSIGARSLAPVEREGPVFFAPTRTTRAYIDMFMSASSPGVSVIEGLAVLWATEVCYLRAWRYAGTFLAARGEDGEDADGGALRKEFIPNWSSQEFEEFVIQIGEVLDLMAGQLKGVEEGELMRQRCLEWWRQVVWLEERFWPVME